ncbi:MAG TPA: hypothetical protein VD927_12430, partial [Chryseosolibacter sp.]|nr:hypothetical protein [Chryseosolibacter sp.]
NFNVYSILIYTQAADQSFQFFFHYKIMSTTGSNQPLKKHKSTVNARTYRHPVVSDGQVTPRKVSRVTGWRRGHSLMVIIASVVRGHGSG